MINKKDIMLVSTSKSYNLRFTDTHPQFHKLNITIFSKKNNFIKKIKISEYYQTLEIKKDRNNLYFYEFTSSTNYEA